MKTSFIFLILLLIISCGVKQPVEIEDKADPAMIFVNSDPTGATIFLNNEETQQFTPDTLTVKAGTHKIQVALNGFKSDQDSIIVTTEAGTSNSVHFQMINLNSFGELIIETSPANASVTIDGKPHSKNTPDTIRIAPGNHDVVIKKNGYKDINLIIDISPNQQLVLKKSLQPQKAVLIESFANVSCTPCVPATENLESFSHSINDSAFYILEYFANWPNANDPFYMVAPSDVMERVMLYNITVLPGLRSAGSWTNPYSTSDITNSYTKKYDELNGEIGISVKKVIKNDSLKVDIELFQLEAVQNLDQMLLFCAITENNISFDTPPGSNGLKDFNWVFRGFLSNKTGDNFVFTDSLFSKSYSIHWNDGWDYSNIKVIAFLQDKNDKSIKYVSGQ